MSRRRRSTNKLSVMVFSILVLAALVVGTVASRLLQPGRSGAFLNIPAYIEAPDSFSGNHYVVEGEVADRLARSAKGAVYALITEGSPLAVVVPQDVRPGFNIEKGQALRVGIRIADDGAAIATTLSKK